METKVNTPVKPPIKTKKKLKLGKNKKDEYLKSLSEKEKIAYKIAEDFLDTSFDLKKSIGYKSWNQNLYNLSTTKEKE